MRPSGGFRWMPGVSSSLARSTRWGTSWRPWGLPRSDRLGSTAADYLSRMQIKALPGFRDFYPEDFATRQHILETWRSVALRYGFEEYDGPPLEQMELYTTKSGEEIVTQLYAFSDKGGREVALRPEMTPTLARMVAARARGLKKPIRWFSMPQLFRYERQQRGRLREHFQLNCDLIGEPGPSGDAEIIALALDIMRALGLGEEDVRVRLSDRRLLNAMLDEVGLPREHQVLAYQLLDKLGRVAYGTARSALEKAGAPPEGLSRLESVREIRDWVGLAAAFPEASAKAEALRGVVGALEAMGLGGFVDIDLTIVRGLAYYTGVVFELFDARGELRAICGGGRYDNLLEALGGDPLPALGFGMGDVVLGELLRERGLLPPPATQVDVFVAAVTPEDLPEVLALAHLLRDHGFRVEYPLAPTAV
ncbi:MAG: histidine--tRNA ligase [Gemmatimonadales bacterium]|nr:MAG: histidine--tRNA ligase [Gemmatimonadales bacterium]